MRKRGPNVPDMGSFCRQTGDAPVIGVDDHRELSTFQNMLPILPKWASLPIPITNRVIILNWREFLGKELQGIGQHQLQLRRHQPSWQNIFGFGWWRTKVEKAGLEMTKGLDYGSSRFMYSHPSRLGLLEVSWIESGARWTDGNNLRNQKTSEEPPRLWPVQNCRYFIWIHTKSEKMM